MPEPVTLSGTCATCHRAVILFFITPDRGPLTPATWRCPHCQAENAIGAFGRVTSVRKADLPETRG